MALKRKISKNRYLLAFLITLIVFTLGLLLGLVIESKRIQLIELQNQQQKLDFSSLQIQYQFIDLFGEEKNCDALKKTFEESSRNLEIARNKLEGYLKESNLNKKEFNSLKREYTLAQLQFWLLIKKTRGSCHLETSTIFYFYSDDEICTQCADQAYILTYLKNKFGAQLLNFAFDAQFEEEPLINVLKNTHQIDQYPALLINGKKFEGLTSQETILKEICPTYKQNKFELCKNYPVIVIS